MIDLTVWFWIGFLGMTGGTIAFVWGGLSAADEYRRYYAMLVAISSIAAVAYAIMALGYGWLTVDGKIVLAPRYIDWILTTPILLAFLGVLAGISAREHAIVIVVNTLVMGLGFAAALLPRTERFVLFGLASVAYVVLLYRLLGPVTESAREQDSGITSLFTSLRNLTVVLWSVYPVVWLLGSPGFAVITPTVDIMLVMYLDLLTKVGFGLIALNASTVIETERGTSVAASGTASSDYSSH